MNWEILILDILLLFIIIIATMISFIYFKKQEQRDEKFERYKEQLTMEIEKTIRKYAKKKGWI